MNWLRRLLDAVRPEPPFEPPSMLTRHDARAAVRDYSCPYCKAVPGQECQKYEAKPGSVLAPDGTHEPRLRRTEYQVPREG